MDNRKPPDTNVVRLRRNGDPSDEERSGSRARYSLSRTRSAPSRAAISSLPRRPHRPPQPPPCSGGPFFEQLQAPPTSDKTNAAAAVGEHDATAAHFERLGSQTPAEMSHSILPQPTAAAMPGSADLTGEVTTSRRRRLRRRHAVASSPGRPFSILRIRVAAPPLLGAPPPTRTTHSPTLRPGRPRRKTRASRLHPHRQAPRAKRPARRQQRRSRRFGSSRSYMSTGPGEHSKRIYRSSPRSASARPGSPNNKPPQQKAATARSPPPTSTTAARSSRSPPAKPSPPNG
jgi:hypothetical protein